MISDRRRCVELIRFVILEHAAGRVRTLPAGGVPELERLRRRLEMSGSAEGPWLEMSGSAESPRISLTDPPQLVTIEVALTRALRIDAGTPPGLVTARHVRRWCVAGRVTARKRGKTWHVDPHEIASMINKGRPSR